MTNTHIVTGDHVDWDKIPADENGAQAIGVGAAPLGFVIDCGDLGRVDREEFEKAEEELNEVGTFTRVLQRVRVSRLSKLFPMTVGHWQLKIDEDRDGQVGLYLNEHFVGRVCDLRMPRKYRGLVSSLRRGAEQLAKLANAAEAAGI